MPRTLYGEQVPRFIDMLEGCPHPYRLAFALMFFGGLRVGEVCQLAWCDVMADRSPLAGIRLEASATKTRRERVVPVTRALAAHIEQAIRTVYVGALFAPAHYLMALCPDKPPVTTRSVQRQLADRTKELFGYPINPHMLRHTFATRLLKVSNLRIVQDALGHKSISSTQVYTHTTFDELDAAMIACDSS